jgi:5-methylcytosine-specific restriction endonuclease McrA
MGGDSTTVFFLLIVIVIIVLLGSRKRSRRIPTHAKRMALGRFFEEHYRHPDNRKKPLTLKDYEFDHIIPFSRGGTNDPDNIRVIPQKENRRKGARMPSIWER